MSSYWQQLRTLALAITTTCFAFIPDGCFVGVLTLPCLSEYWNTALARILVLVVVGVVSSIYIFFKRWLHKKITINGHDYKIAVEYGDILKQDKCKIVVNFDECFTAEVGEAPHQIKPSSLCGQFLQKYPLDIEALISSSKLMPLRKHSEHDNRICYESGTILPYGQFWLMAFGKLNKDGRAEMTRDDYLSCLNKLWKEINKHYTQTDVAIPVLGAGITNFKGEPLSQQQLVDIIVASYKLSPYKIKTPHTLHIVCRRNDEFSLNKIGSTL